MSRYGYARASADETRVPPDVGEATWYGNDKATQVMAKDTFAAINNGRIQQPGDG